MADTTNAANNSIPMEDVNSKSPTGPFAYNAPQARGFYPQGVSPAVPVVGAGGYYGTDHDVLDADEQSEVECMYPNALIVPDRDGDADDYYHMGDMSIADTRPRSDIPPRMGRRLSGA